MGVCDVKEQLWLLQSLLPDYNLAVLTSLPFENCPEKKKEDERFSVKATACNFSPPGRKVNRKFPRPNTCHSPWWAVCLETASRPRLRSLTSPKLPQASQEQMPNRERKKRKRKKKKKQGWCSVCFWIDLVWCKTCFTLCFAAVVVVAVTHLDRDNLGADYTHRKGNLNVLNIIEKSDKQEDLHLNTGSLTDTRCIWITAG